MSSKFNRKIAKLCLLISMGIGTMYFLMNMFMYFTDKVPVLGGGMTYNTAYIDGMKIGILFGYIISPLCYAYATNFKGTKSYLNYIVKEGSIKLSELLTGFLFGSKTKNRSQSPNSIALKKQSTRNNERMQQNTGKTTPSQIDQYVIDALESGFDISPYKNELTTGNVRVGEAYDALEELIEKYDDLLDSAIDNYKHAKKWQGYSGTASDGTIEITYTDSEVQVSYDLGRFTVSHSEANRLGSLKSFAPYIDAIDY
ncbi:hypothetical protein KFV05_02440 [Macrococcoides canis]|uniref:hypothetical protein n=1 Tax=Macrococcoides canis TaxID=1855823 RepID=UPI0020B79828|nr:hypothetical protein [Macrococcus canis]UTH02867.1 hypothetical protein KFV05_02440 [Macrococcus canis]